MATATTKPATTTTKPKHATKPKSATKPVALTIVNPDDRGKAPRWSRAEWDAILTGLGGVRPPLVSDPTIAFLNERLWNWQASHLTHEEASKLVPSLDGVRGGESASRWDARRREVIAKALGITSSELLRVVEKSSWTTVLRHGRRGMVPPIPEKDQGKKIVDPTKWDVSSLPDDELKELFARVRKEVASRRTK